jgi:FlaA1/EpsC-like NDP-sugar epimerase
MTRYFWSVVDAAQFLWTSLLEGDVNNERGCVYVPSMTSYRMYEIAHGMTDKIEYTGLRCLEKLHEDLISEHESSTCYDANEYHIIYPACHDWINNLSKRGNKVPDGFSLKSSNHPQGGPIL